MLAHDLVPNSDVGRYCRRYAKPMYFKLPAFVYLLRDGRDAMVSYRYYSEAVDEVKYDFLEFLSPETRLYFCHWAAHVNGRMTSSKYRAHMLIIKYPRPAPRAGGRASAIL